jgi:hypothetical protein
MCRNSILNYGGRMAKHYLVVYYDNGKDENGEQIFTIHMWPGKSIEDCKEQFDKILDSKFGQRIREFDIIESEPILQVKRDYASQKKERKKRSDAGVKKSAPTLTKEEKKDYSKLSKAELKEILKERGVRTLYHDTIDVLRQKCIDSEK